MSFIFLMTALGATLACVFPKKLIGRWSEMVSGFTAGVMLAASVWSLILPSIESSRFDGFMKISETACGIAAGALFMLCVRKIFPAGETSSFKRLFVAITVHNVPEGLAVGVAFAAAKTGVLPLAAAFGIAFGIGIQNFPEGMAVSMPAGKTYPAVRSLLFGVVSGLVEPVAGTIGYFAVGGAERVMPFLMSFAAGAMIFASFTDVISDGRASENAKTGIGVIIGFLLMMILDNIF